MAQTLQSLSDPSCKNDLQDVHPSGEDTKLQSWQCESQRPVKTRKVAIPKELVVEPVRLK